MGRFARICLLAVPILTLGNLALAGPPVLGPIWQAKLLPDGTTVALWGVVMYAGPDYFYVTQEDGVCGIRIEGEGSFLAYGDNVDLIGIIATNAEKERCVTSAAVTVTSMGIPPRSCYMKNSLLAGGICGGQEALWYWQWVIEEGQPPHQEWLPGVGISTVGLHIKTSGRVTDVDPYGQYFYIDDGSGLMNHAKAPVGVWVECSDMPPPDVGSWVVVSGACSCYRDEETGDPLPRILVDDIMMQ